MRLPLALAVFTMLLAGSLAPSGAASPTWQWRDAQGNIQFSDRPPPQSVPEKDILKRPPGVRGPLRIVSSEPAPEASAPAARSATSEPALSASDRKAQAEEAKRLKDEAAERKAIEASNAKIRADNCKASQAYLRDLEAGQRIARTNNKGEREFLDDQQRAAEIAKARAIAASDCR